MSNVDDEQAQSAAGSEGRDDGEPTAIEPTDAEKVDEQVKEDPTPASVEAPAPVNEKSTGDDGLTAETGATSATTAASPAESKTVAGTLTGDETIESKEPEGKAVADGAPEGKAPEGKAVADGAPEGKAPEGKVAHGTKEVARGGAGDRRQTIGRYWPFALMALCTLVLGVGIFLALDSTKEPSPPQPSASQPAPQKTPPDQLQKYSDSVGGFTLSYPKSWRSIPVPPEGSDLRLVLSTGPPDPAAQVEQKYTEFDAEVKGLTGDKPCGTEGSPCLRQEQVTVAGLNGVRFIYTAPDATSGQNSIHVQYFLRRNQQANLYVIVFQAIPTTDLSGLAPTFDEVLASFQAA